jgi:hypothetical protein
MEEVTRALDAPSPLEEYAWKVRCDEARRADNDFSTWSDTFSPDAATAPGNP